MPWYYTSNGNTSVESRVGNGGQTVAEQGDGSLAWFPIYAGWVREGRRECIVILPMSFSLHGVYAGVGVGVRMWLGRDPSSCFLEYGKIDNRF